jgi:hypothetical protein
MPTTDERPLPETLERARHIAGQMAKAAEGRDENTNAEMPLALFVDISAMLRRLSDEIANRTVDPGVEAKALQRIADLDIRSATMLLEMNAWKRIAGELQAIAQETLGRPRKPSRYVVSSDEDESPTGLHY